MYTSHGGHLRLYMMSLDWDEIGSNSSTNTCTLQIQWIHFLWNQPRVDRGELKRRVPPVSTGRPSSWLPTKIPTLPPPRREKRVPRPGCEHHGRTAPVKSGTCMETPIRGTKKTRATYMQISSKDTWKYMKHDIGNVCFGCFARLDNANHVL